MMLRLLGAVSLVFFFAACDEDAVPTLPRHSGAPGEVLLVMDQQLYDGSSGDTLARVLEAFYPMLPQAEPQFDLLHFTPAEFSNLVRQHRNIILVEIDGREQNRTPRFTLEKDRWARDQLVFRLGAPDTASFATLIGEQAQKIVELVNQTEQRRLLVRFNKLGNEALANEVKEHTSVSLVLPNETEWALKKKTFSWIKRDRLRYKGNTAHDVNQGIFIYSYPYTADTLLEPASILAIRDSLLKRFVPGPAENSYMTTEYRFPPIHASTTINGNYAVITRGLWRTENYFMGGAFISGTFLNEQTQRVVCVSGFVFAPNFEKREYIRELEAVIYSVDF